MYINNKNIKRPKKVQLVGLFLIGFFVTACNGEDNKTDLESHSIKPQSLLSGSDASMPDSSFTVEDSITADSSITTEDSITADGSITTEDSIIADGSFAADGSSSIEETDSANEIKTWHGQDFGFVSADHPAINKIEALIALGKINAATISYRNTSTFLSSQASDNDVTLRSGHAAASINEDVLDLYDSLELVFRNNNIKPFKDSLEQLAKPETIEIYTRNSNDEVTRKQKNDITQASRIISASISNAISVLEPTRKEYILAGSAMLNESGKNLQDALSKDGKITNPSKHQLSISQIDGALSLIPEFAVDACEKQRQISKTYRDNTNEIAEQLMSFDNKPAKEGASDIYELAKETENMAKTLPEKDQDICK